ncbi:hydrolase 1, exosortase A system-associated [Rhodoferax sp. PAMC 29310]|uniref:hydrolase 1, exosortase A system-associated n=1 Tax=Rhodoferax sp. PAMC 29310 TaxID=2822760 RepID=UPI001B324847|nr:hydrolase 1, exosortase A system-associated [Rhodoferax sp. PAMC 29310]
MNFTEETAQFDCEGETLTGILAQPESPAQIGVLIIVGGPQYRAGSHRQFVLLSRALAAAGYAVLRFDYRGMGDSSGTQGDFEGVSMDIAAAIDALQERLPCVKQVALWGLCDAAAAALLYCHETQDSRVTGLCLLNPWVRSEASLARTQVKHYYVQRMQQKEFWLKLVRGGVATQALRGLLQNLRAAFGGSGGSSAGAGAGASGSNPSQSSLRPFQQRMAMAWHQFPGQVLLILSGDDYTAKEFLEFASTDPAWKSYSTHAHLTRHDVSGVDHTFSTADSRQKVEKITLGWITTMC